MRVILIRHGETESNVHRLLDTAHPGAPLNEIGLAQADALVDVLAYEPISAVFSSDITRAVQTASPLSSARGHDPVRLVGLREIQAGEDEMQPIPSRYRGTNRYLDTIANWLDGDGAATIPGGDTRESFFSRYDDAMLAIHATGHHCVAVISHGAAIRTWCGIRVRNISTTFAAQSRLDNTNYLVLDGSPASGWLLESWGEAGPDGVSDSGP